MSHSLLRCDGLLTPLRRLPARVALASTVLGRWRISTRLTALTASVCVLGCRTDLVSPKPSAAVTAEDAGDASKASGKGLAVACNPGSLEIPVGSTVTVSCDVTMPAKTSGALTFESGKLPKGVRLHLAGADTTPTIAAGASSRVFLAADVDSTVAPGSYDGALIASTRGASRRLTISIEVTTSSSRVRMAYLIPSDRTYDPDVAWGIERAARHLQIFYQQQLAGEYTFTLHYPVVEVVRSTRPASYFAANAFYGVGDEVKALLNAAGDGLANVWAVYFDVEPTSATGGLTGLATLPHNDVVGIKGGDAIEPISRWIGGLGHELGHAFGLPHPDGCDADQSLPDCSSLMFLGYLTYPNTYLATVQKPLLTSGTFVSTLVATTPHLFDANAWAPTLLPSGTSTSTPLAMRVAARSETSAARPDGKAAALLRTELWSGRLH